MSRALLRGRRMAHALRGAWRLPAAQREPLPALDSADIARLIETGAGGMVWWRARAVGALDATPWNLLKPVMRAQALQSLHNQTHLTTALTLLAQHNIASILYKGWVMAQAYPCAGMRPYGDIDLLVDAADAAYARDILFGAGAPKPLFVDLHSKSPNTGPHRFADLLSRSREARANGVALRVLGPADNLRLLCLHALKHGIERPLWLCDIALLLECAGDDIDWDVLLGGPPHRARWLLCVLRLARELLGAQPTAGSPHDVALPAWLVPAVLRAWGGTVLNDPRLARSYLSQPRGMLTGLRARWPNPVRATVEVDAAFDDRPRLPVQCRAAMRQARHFAQTIRSAAAASTSLPPAHNR